MNETTTATASGLVLHPDIPALTPLQAIKLLVDDILDHGITSEFALGVVDRFLHDAKEVPEWLSTGTRTSVSDAVVVSPNWRPA
jgi:hypoxanthine phosphoribosyltransferase